ncbi:hypothetical protein INT45_004734, partial [Circinella minor]
MLQHKCLDDLSSSPCSWKKSWHSCTTSSTITPLSPDQQLKRPNKIKKKGTCRNRFCWVRITQQHRVLTRNNSLRRRRPNSNLTTSCSFSSCSSSISSTSTPLTKTDNDIVKHRRIYKTRRRSLHHLHFTDLNQDGHTSKSTKRRDNDSTNDHLRQQHHQQKHEFKENIYDDNSNNNGDSDDEGDRPMVLQNAWTPPITAETLQELSVDQIISNIQLRHDLLFDRNLRFRPNFDGASGKAKQRKAERYWTRLDRAFQHELHYDAFLPILLDQIVEILELLHHRSSTSTSTITMDIPTSPIATTSNNSNNNNNFCWPHHITMDTVRSMFNPDLILRELFNYTFDLEEKVEFLISIFEPMCPTEHKPRIQLFILYFSQKCYAKAFRQCFAILEAIQLDQANRFLREQRNYLVQTCAHYEYQTFQQSKNPHKCDSIKTWLSNSRDHLDWSFLRVYHTALVRLITMEHTPFPCTLQYDQHRLVHQFRAEFIYITTLAILLIPYYYLVGKWWNKTDLQTLKLKLAQQLKKVGITNTYNNTASSSASSYRQFHHFAICACEAAMTTHARNNNNNNNNNTNSKKNKHKLESLSDPTKWIEWLKRHMDTSSEIYKMMHDRVFHVLRRVSQGQLQHNDFNNNTLMPLDRELLALGLRIRAVADLNLATY